MHFYLGVTDNDWFATLRANEASECNFWMPSGKGFGALQPGQEFLFKLKAPYNHIGGGGTFVRSEQLPLRMAWEVFGVANGCASLADFTRKILGYRAKNGSTHDANPMITCVVLEGTVFFNQPDWIPVPADWAPNIVTGKGHDTANPLHDAVWQQYRLLRDGYRAMHRSPEMQRLIDTPARYGAEYLVAPRVGQSAFRLQVLDAYDRRCAMTREHTPMVLEAAHIRPYAQHGTHALANALLLRADFHVLFDAGYVTVDPDYRIQVSPRIAAETANGVRYNQRAGQRIHLPSDPALWPSRELLEWHQHEVFLAG
jgi:putative restriction endonuclease